MANSNRSQEIDWVAARRRLAEALAATEAALAPPPERARAILAERARALARVPEAEAGKGERLQTLVFALANETYAIESRFVRLVTPLEDLIAVPGASELVAGVTNLRGTILPVVDIRGLFGIAKMGLSDLTRVVVLGEETSEFGLLADQVDEIREIEIDVLRPPRGGPASRGRAYLRGIADGTLLVLDGAALLTAHEPWATGGAEAGAPRQSPRRAAGATTPEHQIPGLGG